MLWSQSHDNIRKKDVIDRMGVEMRELSESKNSMEWKNGEDSRQVMMMKKTLKNINSTPISITKKQQKYGNGKKEPREVSNFNTSS